MAHDPKEVIEDGYKLLPKDLAAKFTAVLAALVCFMFYAIWSSYSNGVDLAIHSNNERITRLETYILCTLFHKGYSDECSRQYRSSAVIK